MEKDLERVKHWARDLRSGSPRSPEEELAGFPGAARCVVSLELRDGMLELTVKDDGGGLPDQMASDTVGIEGMRERALLVRGTLALTSDPAGGTTVTLRAPVEAG